MAHQASSPLSLLLLRCLGVPLFLLLLTACGGGASSALGASSTYGGTALDSPAPDFQLQDQNGASITLSALRGQIVVLTFMDTQCKEVCPLTAYHLKTALQSLGSQAAQVTLLGLNVNVAAADAEAVTAASQRWGLQELRNWHFLTGSSQELTPVWKAYGVAVEPARSEGEELWHTAGLYLIDRAGTRRWYISTSSDPEESGTRPLSELIATRLRELLARAP